MLGKIRTPDPKIHSLVLYLAAFHEVICAIVCCYQLHLTHQAKRALEMHSAPSKLSIYDAFFASQQQNFGAMPMHAFVMSLA